MADTVTLSVIMPREAKERLDTLARSMGQSADKVAGDAIASYLEASAWQVEAVRAAVETADAGGPFYAHEDVMGYLEARARGQTPPRPKPIVSS